MPQRLENAELAWVQTSRDRFSETRQMTEYLLNPLNPRAGSEPDDFAKMGYDLRNIDVLERDLVSVAQSYPPTEERVFPDYVTY